MKIYLSLDFIFGTNNTVSIKDFGNLNNDQSLKLSNFLINLKNKDKNCGRNKKSSDTKVVLQKNHAIQYNIWHYHACQYICQNNNCTKMSDCKDITIEKILAPTCSEIIHYFVNNDSIVIFAFSLQHTNGYFPELYRGPLHDRVVNENNIEFMHFLNFFQRCKKNFVTVNKENWEKFKQLIIFKQGGFMNFLEIKDTEKNGRGVFAKKNIKLGEVVEVSPVIIFNYKNKINTETKTPLNSKKLEIIIEKKVSETIIPPEIHNICFKWRNAHYDKGESCIALGYGSLFNCANPANLTYEIDLVEKTIVFTAVRDILLGEELIINYSGLYGSNVSSENDWFLQRGIEYND